jgi:hypothetical protein
MAYLGTFQHDIFLSYGWAGSLDPDRGARAWAGDLHDVLAEWLAVNLAAPQIYFDRSADRVGPVSDDLYRAIQNSALIVFVVSPGSYRPDSWCQKEIIHFWDRSRSVGSTMDVVPPEERILKVIQSPPAAGQGDEPMPLRNLRSFDLFELMAAGQGQVTSAANLRGEKSERVTGELNELYKAVRRSLERIKSFEQNPASGKRVFLGSTFSEINNRRFVKLRRELLLAGHEVRSVTPLPVGAETEDGNVIRLESAMEDARLAVHIVPQALETPGGWQLNYAALQIRQSLLKSAASPAFSVHLWEDPSKSDFDEQCRLQVRENPVGVGDQTLRGTIFENLTKNVKEALRKRDRPREPELPFDVVIEHHDIDSLEAESILEYLDKRHGKKAHAIPALPGENRLRKEKKNQQRYYSRASRFVVLYGRTNHEWADDVCCAMQAYITIQGFGLVVLAPPPAPPVAKRFYRPPVEEFITKRCLDGKFETAIDEWLRETP